MSNISIHKKVKVMHLHREKAIRSYIELAKLKITSFVTLSALLGYVLAGGVLSLEILYPLMGILLLSSGSAALNQLQEMKFDKKMERTRNRPLPAKRLSKEEALTFIISSSLLGIFLLSMTLNWVVVSLGIFSMLWYNAVYTPLKRKSSVAVFPGALLGAIPPMIGWASAGAGIFDSRILAISIFFFIWQIPHFWFLFLIYDEDYKSAGYPTLSKLFNAGQIGRISFAWVLSMAISSLLVPLLGSASMTTFFVLSAFALAIIWLSKDLLKASKEELTKSMRLSFRNINIYVLCVVLILIIDKIINL